MIRRAIEILKKTVVSYKTDNIPLFSAAFGYYLVLSIGPFFLIVLAFLNFVLPESHSLLLSQIFGPKSSQFIKQYINNRSLGSGWFQLLNIGLLIFAALGVFRTSEKIFAQIWGGTGGKSFRQIVRQKMVHFLILIGMVVLFVFINILNIAISLANDYLSFFMFSHLILQVINYAASFVLLSLVLSLFYKAMPNKKVPVRSVVVSAVATAVLVMLEGVVFRYYLTFHSYSVYGAASSIVIFLFWSYLTGQILFFGAELNRQLVIASNAYQQKKTQRRQLSAIKAFFLSIAFIGGVWMKKMSQNNHGR